MEALSCTSFRYQRGRETHSTQAAEQKGTRCGRTWSLVRNSTRTVTCPSKLSQCDLRCPKPGPSIPDRFFVIGSHRVGFENKPTRRQNASCIYYFFVLFCFALMFRNIYFDFNASFSCGTCLGDTKRVRSQPKLRFRE